MDAETLHRLLDRREHLRDRIAFLSCKLDDVLALVAVLGHGLAAAKRVDRRAEAVHLRARVVVVVLARDIVAREREEPRDAVAVGAVARRGDDDRAGRVCGDHLDLHALGLSPPSLRRSPRPSRRARPGRTRRSTRRLMKPGPATSADSISSSARDLLRELRREVPRRPADRLGRAHGDVGREVPVCRVLRALELHVDLRDRADARREACDRVSRPQL